MKRNQYHVVPNGGGWKVEQGSKTLGSYDTKHSAIEEGRKVAHANEPSQLVVHTADGYAPRSAPICPRSLRPPGP
ncbi:DUF2188 domain-containing protein, partial [Micromonospora sp. CPCC 205739]|uniref:DUF2188 domain-containing protein n=1 Tax=Micromonospora sp. CPCC 205739 TaxID=3122404 RepID=UPI002FF122DB